LTLRASASSPLSRRKIQQDFSLLSPDKRMTFLEFEAQKDNPSTLEVTNEAKSNTEQKHLKAKIKHRRHLSGTIQSGEIVRSKLYEQEKPSSSKDKKKLKTKFERSVSVASKILPNFLLEHRNRENSLSLPNENLARM